MILQLQAKVHGLGNLGVSTYTYSIFSEFKAPKSDPFLPFPSLTTKNVEKCMKEWQKLANLGYENLKIWLKYLIFSWFEEPFCYPFFPFLPHLSLMDRTALISLFSVALFAIVAWFAGWLVNWLTDWQTGWVAG